MISACRDVSIAPSGGGISFMIISKSSFTPCPSFALIAGASFASMPIISSISFFTLSGSDCFKSILFKTGKIVKPCSIAL